MNKKFSTGIIDKVIYNDTGNVMYYVIINVDGQFVTAQSINKGKKLKLIIILPQKELQELKF